MARGLSLTDERREQIEGALAAGALVRVAAASAGVSERTAHRWLRGGLIVRRKLAAVDVEAEVAELPDSDEAIQQRLLNTVLRAADHGDWRASVWLLRQRWPERYAR